MRHPTHDNCPTCTARERARIRRLIGPALRELRHEAALRVPTSGAADFLTWVADTVSIATRPEPKRRRGAK